jgi:peptide/nickel transport system ATP-binding protein
MREAPEPAVILEVKHLRKSFNLTPGTLARPKWLCAVADVSFTLHRKQTLAVVGESGSGKSTLAKLVLGLLKPDSGDILVCGVPMQGMGRLEFARKVQPIFQNPYSSLNPKRSISDIVEQPLIVHRLLDPSGRRTRVLETLDLVGIPTRMCASVPSQLSGGQRQRVAIARALILRPDVIVCDEPTSALDVSIQAQILNLLKDIQEEYGISYIFISHNLAVVRHMASHIAVMYRGAIVEQGPVDDIFSRPTQPYTRALLDSILLPVKVQPLERSACFLASC